MEKQETKDLNEQNNISNCKGQKPLQVNTVFKKAF